jgi:predicted PurR-regulated permease PerM
MRAEVSRIRLWRITTRTWIALFTLGLALWWTIRHMPGLSQVLVIAFGAILLDLAMRPIVDLLAQRHVPRWATVVVIYLALFASVGLASCRLGNIEPAGAGPRAGPIGAHPT